MTFKTLQYEIMSDAIKKASASEEKSLSYNEIHSKQRHFFLSHSNTYKPSDRIPPKK